MLPKPIQDMKIKLPLSNCEECPLYEVHLYNPHNYWATETLKQPDVLFIGESPGKEGWLKGLAFRGRAGELLHKMCAEHGIVNYAVANVVACRAWSMSKYNKPKDRKPTSTETRMCKENLDAIIEAVDPMIICTLGAPATKRLKIEGSITAKHGVLKKTQYGSVFPMFHPAYILRTPTYLEELEEDFKTLRRHIDGTFEEKGPGGKYRVLTNMDQVLKAEKILVKAKHLAFDIESDGLFFYKDKVLGVGFSHKIGYAYYFPLITAGEPEDRTDFWSTKDQRRVIKAIKNILGSNSKKVAHNGKFDQKFLKYHFDIDVKNFWLDTMLLHYIMDENKRHGLKEITGFLFPEMRNYDAEINTYLSEKKKSDQDFGRIPTQVLGKYCGMDCESTLRIAQLFLDEASPEIKKLLFDFYMPLSAMYVNAELMGVKVDTEYVRDLRCQYEAMAAEELESVYEYAEEEFNLNSYIQLGRVLYEELGFKIIEKTASGNPATGMEVLKELPKNHPKYGIIQSIMDFRSHEKMISTYFKSALDKVDENDRIHPAFKLHGTVTGRLSSEKPNIQNIPRESLIKGMFIPEKGFEIIEIDYSQIELRVMAFYSQDIAMTQNYIDEEDIHLATASEIFKIPPEQVTKIQRKYAKLVNFGCMYGASPQKLMDSVNKKLEPEDRKVTLKEAEKFRVGFFKRYPGIGKYITHVHKQIRRDGYTENIFGRRRRLPEIRSHDEAVVAEAQRQGLNANIQGTSSDLTQLAVTRLPSIMDSNTGARFLFSVHDAIILENPIDERDFVFEVKALMEDVPDIFDFPVVADLERFPERWGNDPIEWKNNEWVGGKEY